MTELVKQHRTSVRVGCRLFGHCHQAYYQFRSDFQAECDRERHIVQTVKEIRQEDPRIGGYKLWLMLRSLCTFGKFPGRDKFMALLRRHHLMLPRPKPRCTTNSNHRYHKWKNLLSGFVPYTANQLWVSDITYVSLAAGGVCYLHLITDAYSHKIVGWMLADTLRAAITLQALEEAVKQAGGGCLEGLIHHSDRGVQYCCDAYIEKLQEHKIAISMTEDSNPTDNAVAERVNGIIKVENIYPRKPFNDLLHAKNVIGRYIHFYNNRRPHMSIGYKIPAQVHLEQGPQKKMWKKKIYPSKRANNEIESLSLANRIADPGESVCR